MKSTVADRIIDLNSSLKYKGRLPKDVTIMNPYKESTTALSISNQFYKKYFSDSKERRLILGINPGRLGAGITGIPFTDTKRLEAFCNMSFPDLHCHEPSSVYVYDLIMAYGGPEMFYSDFFINSVCPLGFLIKKENGKNVNYNYYDSKELQAMVEPFIIENIRALIELGMRTDKCFIFGNNKNYKYMNALNLKHNFFDELIALEHPRYIIQYKSKTKHEYVTKFLKLLGQNQSEE